MKKILNKRNLILLTLTAFMAISCFSAVALGNYGYVASAENTASFWMTEGAQVKLMQQNDSGLRFVLNMSADQYEALKAEDSEEWDTDVQVGMLMIPETLLGTDELTLDNTTNAYIVNTTLEQDRWIADDEEEPTKYSAWVAIGGYDKENYYNVDVTAIGYLKDGDSAAVYTTSYTRSMAEVAYINRNLVVELPDGTKTDSTWLERYYVNYVKTVLFQANDGSEPTEVEMIAGKTVAEPTVPQVNGWTFDGWYNGAEKWDFATKVTEDITLNAKYTQTVTVADTFEVYSGIVETTPTANTLEVALTSASAMTVANATVSTKNHYTEDKDYTGDISNDYTWKNNKLTIAGDTFGSSVYGDVKIQLADESGAYTATVNAKVVTKYINTLDDMKNLAIYGGIDPNDSTGKYYYNGYFVLTKTLDNNYATYEKAENFKFSTAGINMNNIYQDWYGGFQGIFDGQGYSIKNVALTTANGGGIFGNVDRDGVVKNLGVSGSIRYTTKNSWDKNYMLALCFLGTLQNCYIQIDETNASGDLKNFNPIAGNTTYMRATDVVVKFDASRASTSSGYIADVVCYSTSGGPLQYRTPVFKNVHAFVQDPTAGALNPSNSYNNLIANAGIYGTESDNKVTKHGYNDTVSVTMTDASYWDMTGKQPVFASIGEIEAMPFEVYSSITDGAAKANDLTIDLTKQCVTAIDSVSVVVGDSTIALTADNYTWTDNKLTIAGETFGASVYGDASVVICGKIADEAVSINYNTTVVTKYINSLDDMKNLAIYGGIDPNDSTGKYYYDGYFVLTKTLDNNYATYEKAENFKFSTTKTDINVYYNSKNFGFQGVFDGQGYSIKNINLTTGNSGGLFGNVDKGGVVKNLGVSGSLRHNGTNNALLAYIFAGTLQNCYVQVDELTENGTAQKFSAIAYETLCMKATDVVIKFDGSKVDTSTGYFANIVCRTVTTAGSIPTFKNVHTFVKDPEGATLAADNWYESNLVNAGAYGTAEENKLTKHGYTDSYTFTVSSSTSEASYWTTKGGQPIFASMVAAE